MNLLSISKCSAEAFNRSKYWRQSECLDVNELNNNLKHNQNIPEIHIRFSLHLQKKVRFKNGSVINLQMSSKSL